MTYIINIIVQTGFFHKIFKFTTVKNGDKHNVSSFMSLIYIINSLTEDDQVDTIWLPGETKSIINWVFMLAIFLDKMNREQSENWHPKSVQHLMKQHSVEICVYFDDNQNPMWKIDKAKFISWKIYKMCNKIQQKQFHSHDNIGQPCTLTRTQSPPARTSRSHCLYHLH